MGGEARARTLSPEERRGIARNAAAVRWNIPRATHQGKLPLGEYVLNCAVLDDGTRVFSERSIAKALGVRGGGAYWKRKKRGGANLPEYISATYLRQHLGEELALKLSTPITYLSVSKIQSRGIEAGILAEICDFWIKLQKSGALDPQHTEIAEKAYILMRGYAKAGIIALVDEATGYQEVRDRLALQKILEKFISKELLQWTKRFPDEFYQQMFRLKGWQWQGIQVNRPQVVGHYTNNIVYERLAPGVLAELRRLNPTDDSGYRPHKHHQWLTPDIGHPKLRDHINGVLALMRATQSWDQFKKLLNKAFPKRGATLELDLND